jgi:hypothetical protein
MKIELKKISFNERMSQETSCFVADLYINGKKVGSCENDGRGGCTNYGGNTKEDNAIIAEAEKYFKSQPKVKVKEHNFEYDQSLEHVIDDCLEAYLKERDEKKKDKRYATAICFGVPNGLSYSYLKYKTPLASIPKFNLQKEVDGIKAKYCKNGIVILNTNLSALGITI